MATVPVLEEPRYAGEGGHFEKDARFDRFAPSLEPVGLVFESDPAAPAYKGPSGS